MVDWAAIPNTAKLDPNRAARYLKIAGPDAWGLRVVLSQIAAGEIFTPPKLQLVGYMERYGCPKHSIRMGTEWHVMGKVAGDPSLARDLDAISVLAKRASPSDTSRTMVGHAGHLIDELSWANKLAALL